MRRIHLALVVSGLTVVGSAVWAVPVQMASKGIVPTHGNGSSYSPSISADGRYVAFESYSSNLVPDDTNGAVDVFVYDRVTDTVVRASVDSQGHQAARGGQRPAISANGKWVAFDSTSGDLADGDDNVILDVFAHNLETGATILVSHNSAGKSGNRVSMRPSIAHEGVHIVFESLATDLVAVDTNHVSDVFMYNRLTKQMTLISRPLNDEGNAASQEAVISANGRYVAFSSSASNLVPFDTNGAGDVFVKDMQGGQLGRASLVGETGGLQGTSEEPSISADGRFVVFRTTASNASSRDHNTVRDVYVRDRASNVTIPVSVGMDGTMTGGSEGVVSPCGTYVAYTDGNADIVPGDTNGYLDVFLFKIITRDIVRVPVTRMNAQAIEGSHTPAVSDDGKYIAFVSRSNNIIPGESSGQQAYVTPYAENPDLPRFVRGWREYAGGGAIPPGVDQNGDAALDYTDAATILGKFLQYMAGL